MRPPGSSEATKAEQELVPPMTTVIFAEFIAELDGAVETGSPGRRSQILRKVTDLFLFNASRLDASQVQVFDDVFARLLAPADTNTLAKVSLALSDLTDTPRETVRRLALHEDAAIASPILRNVEALPEGDLVEVANNRSQQHLLAIAGRTSLSKTLTDSLLKRSDTLTCRVLARNAGARISEQGYSTLVAMAGRDDQIAESLVSRTDMPVRFLQEFLFQTTRASRSRLLKLAPSTTREMIGAAIASVEGHVLTKAPDQIDYSEAKSVVLALNKSGKLNDSKVNRFAVHGERLNLIAALSLLAAAPIETIQLLMEEEDGYGLMVACRASRLDWQTALVVAANRKCARRFEAQELEQLKATFAGLPLSVAERTIRFESPDDCAVPMMPRLTDGNRRNAGSG
jgi:uncharacterized protein (DUF2336 family)